MSRQLLPSVVAAVAVLLAGCVSPYQAPGGPGVPEVVVQRTASPVTSMTWATESDQLLGLTEDDRLVKLDRDTGAVLDAVRLSSAGGNIALVTHPTELAYVAQPEQGSVAVVETATMRQVDELSVSPAPQWVAAHPTSHTLLVLSRDGSSVTGVDLETRELTLREQMAPDPAARIVEAEETRTPAFWVTSPGSAVHFGGQPLTSDRVRAAELDPETFSPDRDTPGAGYAALDGRILALEVDGGDPTVTAERDIGEVVEHVESKAKEDFRVFVTADDALRVHAFDTLAALAVVDYGAPLEQAGLADSRVGGVVVGDLYVYLPLEEEPYLLRIRKPSE